MLMIWLKSHPYLFFFLQLTSGSPSSLTSDALTSSCSFLSHSFTEFNSGAHPSLFHSAAILSRAPLSQPTSQHGGSVKVKNLFPIQLTIYIKTDLGFCLFCYNSINLTMKNLQIHFFLENCKKDE